MMKMQKLLFIAVFIGFCALVSGQTAAEYQANYAKRIKLETINGVYIPMSLEDAFSELNRLADPKGLANFKNAPDSMIEKSHFGLIQWVQHNWGLDDGSRLSYFMKTKGISTPDDMSRVIVVTYHRRLNGQPLKLEEEAAAIEKRIKDDMMRRDSLAPKIVIEKRPHKP